MHATTLLVGALAALSNASPMATKHRLFQVTNFVYGCTSTCDWSYNIAVLNDTVNHPAVAPVYCHGSTTTQSFTAASCDAFSHFRFLETYIDKDNKVQIQYTYLNGSTNARYMYGGQRHVNAETSGKPQAQNFTVAETSAMAVG